MMAIRHKQRNSSSFDKDGADSLENKSKGLVFCMLATHYIRGGLYEADVSRCRPMGSWIDDVAASSSAWGNTMSSHQILEDLEIGSVSLEAALEAAMEGGTAATPLGELGIHMQSNWWATLSFVMIRVSMMLPLAM